MKKGLILAGGLGMFLLVGVSVAQAQFVVGARVEVVTGTYNLNIRPTASTAGTALGSVNSGAKGVVTDGPVFGQGYSWSKVRWDGAPEGWSVNTPWLRVISAPQSGCGDVNKDGVPNIVDVNLVIDVAFRGQIYPSYNTDVNGSGVTDIIDVAEEVDYVFRGQPEPTGCVVSSAQLNVAASSFVPSYNEVGPGQPNVPWRFRMSASGDHIQIYSFRLVSDSQSSPSPFSGPFFVYNISVAPSTIIDASSTPVVCGGGLCWSDISFSVPQTVASGSYYDYDVYVNVSSEAQGQLRLGINDITVTSYSSGQPAQVTGLPTYGKTVNVISINNQPPEIQSFTGPSILVEDTYGTWTALANDPNGDRLAYIFEWGDNSPASTTVVSNATSGYPVSVQHFYANPGTYPIILTVRDPNFATDYATTSVVVQPSSTLAITGLTWPSALQVGEVGTWSVFATGSPSNNMLTYEFYWGDGTGVSTTAWGGYWVNQTHSYSQPGYYSSARVTVQDDLGGSDMKFTPVTVSNPTSTSNKAPVPTLEPVPIKTSPTRQPLLGASTYDSLQRQIDLIFLQLQLLKEQLR